jgi:hypothetical protein
LAIQLAAVFLFFILKKCSVLATANQRLIFFFILKGKSVLATTNSAA